MRIVSKRVLREFWEIHPQSRLPLETWYRTVTQADWQTPADAKLTFGNKVDFVADNRIVFDISGNKYRLIVHVFYPHKTVRIKFIGTHAKYDKINVETIQ